MWDQQVPYAQALTWQRRLLAEHVAVLRADATGDGAAAGLTDTLLLMQHPPVLTLGTSSTLDNVRDDSPPFELVRTERGGEVTYHGPGQLVLYPILNLRAYRQDVHWYMRSLEEVAIRVAHSLGLPAGREPGLTGVWIEQAKVCAIGVKLSRWVTMHGLALNVDVRLEDFSHIVPCGIADRPVTSLSKELRERATSSEAAGQLSSASLETVQQLLLQHFSEVFDVELATQTLDGQAPWREQEVSAEVASAT
eukprot:CAMPEP_0115867884 /NCGR_PEP_ID=MMETSP0287-20121206/20998_1 /TAXON_ID=412157 /ORGANISM="Chrysochromulina rotalis, Strain UIO044" /LENGTH=250 /DNA_ID=CAMNT_0003322503 /DNA_START=29 /DNA_END=781 /DNA_ORIENTATION=-